MRLTRTLHLSAILVLCVVATPLIAQDDEDPELTGHVVSAETGEPIAGAFVGLQGWERGTYSWRDGHFRLPEVPARPANYSVRALGYESVAFNTDATRGEHTIEMMPDSALQAGLVLLFARLDDRRNGGRVFDRQALAFSGAYDLAQMLTTRGVRRVRKYCLDEQTSPGLGTVAPRSFYRVEVFGSAVRVYTEEFLESTARESPERIKEIIRLRLMLC